MSLIVFAILAVLALGLTITMFIAKQSLLGFPSGIFWAISGAYAYQQYTTVWDLWYLVFFAAMGMLIFTIFAAFALRKKDLAGPDIDAGNQYIDEGGGGHYLETPRRRGSWGDIDELGMNDLEDEGYISPQTERVRGGMNRVHERLNNRRIQRRQKAGLIDY